MWQLKRFFKPYIWWIILIVILLGVQAWSNLALPDYMSSIISQGIAMNNMNFVYSAGIYMLLITLLGSSANILVGLLASRVSASATRDIRQNIFQKITTFSQNEFDRFSTASLITRSTNDTTQIQNFSMALLRMVAYAPIIGIGGIFMAIQKAGNMPQMAVIILSAVTAIAGMAIFVLKIVVPRFEKIQKIIDKLNLVSRESLAGMLVIRAFNNQTNEERRFGEVNDDLMKNDLFVNRMMSLQNPFMVLVMNGMAIAIFWVGSYLAKDITDVGNLIAFSQYAMQIVIAFLMVSMMFIFWPRAAVSGKRISEVLNVKVKITDPKNPQELPTPHRGEVEFREVSFSYPGSEEKVLDKINFTAQAGKTTAIIGGTGSGKSTLINLIPRLYDVTAGAILIDGVDVRNLKLADLRSMIGFVPQKGILFSGTIASNLRYANLNASQKELVWAAGVAQAADFIETKPKKYDDDIAQGGTNVSGGQKQRLAIARALITKAPIFVFDDSFSALDFKTDAALRRALQNQPHKNTTIIVGQRISTVMNADQIIVLNNGKVVGHGIHEELLLNCRVYREIAQSQLSFDELETETQKKKGGK